ncbi:MAG: hypothetical protein ACE5IL_02000 [Myxococcota bacterium]
MSQPPRIDPDQIPDAIWKQMNISRERFAEIREEMRAREARAPQVGSVAFDFELERLAPDGARTRESTRLSDSRGRPVALVFGSYT